MATMLSTTTDFEDFRMNSTYIPEYDYPDIGNSGPCDYGTHASYVLPVLYSLFFIVGFLGNMLVLWVILRRYNLESMTNVSLLNLAIADLLLIFSLPFLAHYARDTWVFGNEMCVLVLSIYYIGFYVNIFFIVLMSIDRYLVIVNNLNAMSSQRKSPLILASMVIWIIAIVTSFPELLYLGIRTHGKEIVCNAYPKDENHNEVGRAAFFKIHFLGLCIVTFCYSKMYQVCKTLQPTPTNIRRKIVMRLVFSVMVVFFCCWIPYYIAAVIKALELKRILTPGCENSKRIQLFLQVAEAITYLHSCLKPLLHVCLDKRLKTCLADTL